ncbi:hypothetical protein DUI87_31248 [Hirundo rustica rustica]|uniref:RNA-directed DNA polymerase n=1 Tax=Hirundo rustica rustica TaxID=333673 RepID=A0A3M0J040_HIRRU|nr:hypothetical protein DUI87_31248 [Hirundo rustica rustica]
MIAQIIIKARTRLQAMAGKDFTTIYLPLKKDYFDWALQKSEDLQIAMLDYSGVCTIHFPSHRLLKAKLSFREKPKISEVPLDAITVFTDGSGKTHKSVSTWQDDITGEWKSDIRIVQGSPQIVELAAVVRAFELFQQPFNLITDSAYVANVVKRLDGSLLREVDNENLYSYLLCMRTLLQNRKHKYFVSHIRAHFSLPGFLAEGNEHADKLTMPISRTLPNIFEQAKLSHAFFHQNAQALMDTFHISRSQAKEIISACPDCQLVQPPTSMGAVNPRGLHSLQLWRTDVTKYPSFGKLKNVHVSVDTFSGAVFASLHTGETAQHACRHFLQAFASLGVPQEIKTDNGPTYIGKVLDKFLKRWGVHHTFGIPHPPTGQAIIERTHQTLKSLLDRQKRGEADATPYMRLNKALYVLNFLNCSFAEPTPPIIRHFSNITRAKLKENPLVLVRNPETGQIEGPFKLITWGKGYACVSTAAGPKWLAARHVKPYRVQTQAETDPKTGGREVGTQT